MVKELSQAQSKAIVGAVAEAGRFTSAEIAVAVARSSDDYLGYVFLTGIMAGSLAALLLWSEKIIAGFSLFVLVQLIVIASFCILPALRRLCVKIVPLQIRQYRAAHKAADEYFLLTQAVSALTPLVVFYVSMAEHYANIFPNPIVLEKIPSEIWEGVMQEFIANINAKGLPDAVIEAVSKISGYLSAAFPCAGG